MNTRTCRLCGETKPFTAQFFNSNRRICKSCKNAAARLDYALCPESTRLRADRYLRRLKAADGTHSKADIEAIRRKLKDRCFYCGHPLLGKGEKDHLVPLSNGGSNWAGNITLACVPCNRDKCDKSVFDFFEWRKARGLDVAASCLVFIVFSPEAAGVPSQPQPKTIG